MKKLRKFSLLMLSGLLMLTLLGGTPIKPKTKKAKSTLSAKKIVYEALAVVLEDSIQWYRNNWKLNKNLLIKKHQLEEVRSWK